MTPTPNNEALKEARNYVLAATNSESYVQRKKASQVLAQIDAALASSGQAASAVPEGWPCEIAEADFEADTITVHMLTSNYVVRAGKHYLSASPTQPASAPMASAAVPVETIKRALREAESADLMAVVTTLRELYESILLYATPAAPAQPRDREPKT